MPYTAENFFFRPIVFALLLGTTPLFSETVPVARIHAGSMDREDSIVHVEAPRYDHPVMGLMDDRGVIYPAQVSSDGILSLRLSGLKRGESRLITGVLVSNENSEDVVVAKHGKKLRVTDSGKTLFEYQAEPGALPRPGIDQLYTRGGYLHPILSPRGVRVSEDFPTNHVHHHGIWFPWTKTEFQGRHPDFWNMGDGSGKVEFVSLREQWSGAVQGGFRTEHRFVDLSAEAPVTALQETWEVMAYSAPETGRARNIFDLKSSQQCATEDPLVLPLYRYGGLGFRGRGEWDGKENCRFLTSNGETDRVKGHATRARWCHVGGLVDGKLAGVAILSHPSNFRAPQPMRIHPNEPFFNFAPQQAGEMRISSGETYVSRYRFVVVDGEPDRDEIEAWWEDYADPATIEWLMP
jgi:hypothetical protein